MRVSLSLPIFLRVSGRSGWRLGPWAGSSPRNSSRKLGRPPRSAAGPRPCCSHPQVQALVVGVQHCRHDVVQAEHAQAAKSGLTGKSTWLSPASAGQLALAHQEMQFNALKGRKGPPVMVQGPEACFLATLYSPISKAISAISATVLASKG